MATDSVSLISQIRDNLLSAQRNAEARSVSELRLSTGRRLNSISDDPVNYFRAHSLTYAVTRLTETRVSIGQGISTINAALEGAEGVRSVLNQMKGVAEAARSAVGQERVNLADQFNQLRDQVGLLAQDATYLGVNLLSASSSALSVTFGTENDRLTVDPADVSAASLGITAVDNGGFGFSSADDVTAAAAIDSAVAEISAALSNVNTIAGSLGSNLQVLSVRAGYSSSAIANLGEAADKLSLADPTEEAARLVSLRTRRQLGMTALAIANESQRSLLAII